MAQVVVPHRLHGASDRVTRKQFDQPNRRRFRATRHMDHIVQHNSKGVQAPCEQQQPKGIKPGRSNQREATNGRIDGPILDGAKRKPTRFGRLQEFPRYAFHEFSILQEHALHHLFGGPGRAMVNSRKTLKIRGFGTLTQVCGRVM